jgi:hypothetical protein
MTTVFYTFWLVQNKCGGRSATVYFKFTNRPPCLPFCERTAKVGVCTVKAGDFLWIAGEFGDGKSESWETGASFVILNAGGACHIGYGGELAICREVAYQ